MFPHDPPASEIKRPQDALRAAAVAVRRAVQNASKLTHMVSRTTEDEAALQQALEEMDRAVDAETAAFDHLSALQLAAQGR